MREFSVDDLRPFVLDAVLDLPVSAEFREVASVFISFEANDLADEFVTRVLKLATGGYDGYFRHVDYADKGAVIVIFFGAPMTHENDLTRAADFLLAVRQENFSLRWRAGLTYGTVFAGFVGGPERTEYACIGDQVNLASRLMSKAEWGETWATPAVTERLSEHGYRLETVGTFAFKGKRQSIPVARLSGRRVANNLGALIVDPLVGREPELQQLIDFVAPIQRAEYAGVLALFGEPGLGKSRLLNELRQSLSRSVQWFVCPTAEGMPQALHPFRHFLRQHFQQIPNDSLEANRERFDFALGVLIDELRAGQQIALADEVERTRSVLAALIDLRWSGSLYEQLDTRQRFEHTLQAFKTLMVAECWRRPVVLHLDGAHWLDDESLALLRALTASAAGQPLAIILSSRYRDDGSQYTFELTGEVGIPIIELRPLFRDGVQACAEAVLEGSLTPGLVSFFVDKAGGNPLFIEQLALYLRERYFIEQDDGLWRLTAEDITAVPESLGALLVARLDRLPGPVKQIVQTAAVLGQEFEVAVLHQMMPNDAGLMEKIAIAEREAIWQPIGVSKYTFKNALLRDAAYTMQLRVRLRELHALAARAITEVYAADLEGHTAELAYHYGRANDI